MLVVGADGVWSDMRGLVGGEAKSRFSGQRRLAQDHPAESPAGSSLAAHRRRRRGHGFLAPGFHLIAYPVRGGAALNLVAFTAGNAIGETWSGKTDPQVLKQRDAAHRTGAGAARRRCRRLDGLADPHGRVRADHGRAPGGIALIGDAAHAMTPYAAQGAAMAIEDAETLAGHVLAQPDSVAAALAAWEKERRQRIERVARRGNAQPLRLACLRTGGDGAQPVPEGCARRKSSPPTSTGSMAGNRPLSSCRALTPYRSRSASAADSPRKLPGLPPRRSLPEGSAEQRAYVEVPP